MLKNVELLAPAGNLNKLKTAFYFGADAAYIGGKLFSLRSFADNFDADEMKSAITLAHSLGKKVYVTVNIFAKNADMAQLEDYFSLIYVLGDDAAIISDSGVVYSAKKAAPQLKIHISTQANLTNKYAVKFWQEQGATRAILARELSLDEIAEIHSFVPDIELETFVHGAMCISYSGRCLLSDYLSGRPSNRGECVQACRWNYAVKKKDVGATYMIAGIIDGNLEDLVNVLDLANKGQNPRVTRTLLDSYIDDPDTDIDQLCEDVLGFLRSANATKKTVIWLEEKVEEAKAKQNQDQD